MLNPNFVILGALISFIGGLDYVINTLRGKTKPNRVTWLMWTLAPMIAFAAEVQQGVGLRSLMTFMVGFNPLLVLVASFVNTKATWKLTKFDFACGALSLLGLLLWLASGRGNIAILFSIVADGLAALPTIVKSYSHPRSESWLVFLGGGISAGITLLTIKVWTFANYGFPLYILLVCLVLTLLIRFEFGKRLNSMLR